MPMKIPVSDGTTAQETEATASATQQRYLDAMVATVQQLARDSVSIGDLKLASGAIKEMRRAFKLFAPYRHVRKVSSFGSARTQAGDPVFDLAERFAARIADCGYMVITGAGPGIMEACQRGAGRHRSFGINIRLPFEQAPNLVIHGDPKLMNYLQ